MSTYVIPSGLTIIDGAKLTADKIVFDSKNSYPVSPYFKNLKNVEITNQGPVSILPLKFDNCSLMRIGGNKVDQFQISGGPPGGMGVQCSGKPTDIEVSYLEIFNVGFAGVMIKDDAALRGTFTSRNLKIHHNHIHDTGGEGLYLGSSFWSTKPTHDLENVDIHDNLIERTGWDGMQLGSCPNGARIYNNQVYFSGTKKEKSQNSGIQIGEGTGGLCYNNKVGAPSGTGIICLGNATNVVFQNEIIDAGESGVFADVRGKPIGSGFKFASNTIVNPVGDCFLIYARGVKNELVGNTLIAPGGEFVRISNGSVCSDINNIKMK